MKFARLPLALPFMAFAGVATALAADGNETDVWSGLQVLGFLAAFYFAPALIAKGRNHHNALAIFVLNLFLGWTVIGWVAALVWAATAVKQPMGPIDRGPRRWVQITTGQERNDGKIHPTE